MDLSFTFGLEKDRYRLSTTEIRTPVNDGLMNMDDSDSEEGSEVENVTLEGTKSALDAFEAFMES